MIVILGLVILAAAVTAVAGVLGRGAYPAPARFARARMGVHPAAPGRRT